MKVVFIGADPPQEGPNPGHYLRPLRRYKAIPIVKSAVRPEAFIYIAFFVFTSTFLLLNSAVFGVANTGLMGHSVKLGGVKVLWLVGVTVALLVGMTLVRAIVLLVSGALHNVAPSTVFRHNILHFRIGLLKFLKELVFVGIPFILAFVSLIVAAEQLNIFNSTRLQDELIMEVDFFLTRTFPPFSTASWPIPSLFMHAVVISFGYLVPLLLAFAAYLFQKQQRIFREAAGAFFACAMVMFAGWALFPVMSPHDRFIDNVYDLPVSGSIETYLEAYSPQETITTFLEMRRASKDELSVMPTTTLPSAHTAWGIFLVYYAWRVSRRWGLLAAPVALLSMLGTVLLAQHYFVDVPAGIAVAILSILAASYAAKAQKVYCRRDHGSLASKRVFP